MSQIKSKEMVKVIVNALLDKKAEDVRVLDIGKITVIADYFVIASSANPNQMQALVDNVEEQMYKAGFDDPKREGRNDSSWLLLDYSDVVIHIFSAEDRGFYDIERIWRDGEIIDIENI